MPMKFPSRFLPNTGLLLPGPRRHLCALGRFVAAFAVCFGALAVAVAALLVKGWMLEISVDKLQKIGNVVGKDEHELR